MFDSCDNLVFSSFAGLLIGLCALVVGYLLWLEMKQIGCRSGGRRERRGPPGIAVPVHGLGFRSEASISTLMASSRIWTATAHGVDTRHGQRRIKAPALGHLSRMRPTVFLGTRTRTA